MKILVEDLNYKYSTSSSLVLNNLSFTLEKGSYWCLSGPNGSGKSTLLKLLAGLLPINSNSSGKILLDSNLVEKFTRAQLAEKIGFVPSQIQTHFPTTVFDFIAQGRYSRDRLNAVSLENFSAQTKQKTDMAMEQTGIAHLREKLVTEISEGEQQLVLISRAIANDPEILLLDESISNLDSAFQYRIFGLLEKFHNYKMTVILVSHDLNTAAEFCTNLLWLKNGNLLVSGKFEDTVTQDFLNHAFENFIMESPQKIPLQVSKNPFTGKPKIFWKK